ncbi:MAG: sugar kinase [Candidatus Omnitrophica bacterium]|nr:sugar kinase [Candidatus Omnitrophota bacterium]
MSILVVGTVALDTIETPFGKAKNILGGSATYSAVAASFFGKVKLVSVAGKDFPRKYISFLQSRNIDTEGLQIKKGKTFRWSGRYTYDLNAPKTLKTELNLLSDFNPRIPGDYQNEEFVFLANIDPQVQLAVLRQLKNPKLVVCDTMNYWIEHEKTALKRIVKRSNILVLNDGEARELSQHSNLIKAGKWLLGLGPSLVIIKRGEYGCLLFSPNFTFSVPAYLLEELSDPTGAGDTFAGGFLGYLASCNKISDSSLKKAIVYGTIMASYVVEDFSLNRLKKLKKKDIKTRFTHFQRMTRF